ncbi:hypothetical protein CVT25_000581 [Psilocybe cyanescens]|uniref:Uncharacterized protein n=1 Tax=Psilocybe cyanescens TaxID=93625 RepID=A0A409WZT2_PSICY|nr:hypothetical protein CVT25_000581 [Psilocybe cyanescens]
MDEDSDPGISEEMPPPFSDHRDFQLAVNFTLQDRNLQAERSRSPIFAPHIFAFGCNPPTRIVSGTISSSPGSPAMSTHSQISAHSPFDASLARSIADNAPIVRNRDVEKCIKLPVQNNNFTDPLSEEPLATATATGVSSSTWLLSSEDAQRSYICAPSPHFSELPGIIDSFLISSSQTSENLVNTNDQTPLALASKQPANFFLAGPHPSAAAAPEHFAELNIPSHLTLLPRLHGLLLFIMKIGS